MFNRHKVFSSAAVRPLMLAVAAVCFFTIATNATSAAGFSIVDSVKQFLGLAAGNSSNDVDQPDAPVFTDDFEYPAGSLLTANGWTAHSGAGTNPLTVAAPGLSYPGYAGSGVGNAVPMTTTGEDAHRTYAPQTAGSVYAAVMVNVSAAANDPLGGYVFHLGPDPISTTFRGRLYIKTDATGLLSFGITKASSSDPLLVSYTPFSYATNTTHLIVIKYTIVDGPTNDTVDFFVNPPLGGAEPPATGTAPDVTATDINPGSVALRQGSNATAPTLVADGIRVGTSWSDVAGGGGGGTPSPTPTQGGATPTPTPSPSPSPSATPSPVASPSPTVPPVPFTSGNVVMYRVGDGTGALSNAATVVFLDEYTTTGTFVQSIRMPIEQSGGTNYILTASGTSTAEGLMTQSVDGRYVVLTGYHKPPGGTNPSADPPATTPRVIGRVDANAFVNTETGMSDPTGNIRSAASTNGIDLWMTASGNGSRYTMLEMNTTTQLATTPTNLRATAIFNGQLYVSSATGAFQGISTVGTGLPTTSGQTITLLNGFPTTAGPSPFQFAFFNTNTLYVADDRSIATGGGIQKWTLSGGTWSLVNTFNNGLTAGVRGLILTGDATARIFATTADNPSNLVTMLDDGSASPPITVLATTAASTAWRSIAFAPSGGGGATPSPTPPVTPTPPTTPSPTPTPPATPSPTPATPSPTPTPPATPTPSPSPSASPSPSPSPSGRTAFDFDGDHLADVSVWRPSVGQWWLLRSTAGPVGMSFGESTDIPRAADYTGGGLTDVAFFRPSTSEWYILRSEDSTYYAFTWGASGDVPAPGDFDGDGSADAAVYRPSSQTWFIVFSAGGNAAVPFGLPGDIPVPADYDGDGQTDVAIFRPDVGQWWILRSSNGTVFAATFGESTDKPVPGDYTGDGSADIGFFRPSEGNWYVLRSEDQTYYAFPWGNSADRVAPADYDGDGKYDAAIYRPSDTTWYILRSTGGVTSVPFGVAEDIPVPGQSVP